MSTASQFIPGVVSSLASNSPAGPISQVFHHTSTDNTTQIAILNEMPTLFAGTEPTTTHASHERKSLSTYELEYSLTKVDVPDDEDPDDPTDMTDAIDADTFEILHLGRNGTTRDVPEMACVPPPEDLVPPPEGLVPPPEDLAPSSMESKANTTEDMPLVTAAVIDRFPNGSPGTPISGAYKGSSMEDTSSEVLQESIWAPFSSQCDWEITCTVKSKTTDFHVFEQ